MVDRLIAALAERQHGVVAVWQLLELGLSRGAIQYRVSIGRLHLVHRGVYAVGHRKLTRHGHWMAAVLAYGPDAVLSHRSAAALWAIGQSSYKIDVTTPHSKRHRRTIRAHTARLDPEDHTTHDGIPVTSVARTIFDLAAQISDTALTRLIEESDRRELFDLRALDRATARRPRTTGVVRLNQVLAAYRGTADTRSNLERGFRALIADAGLPEPPVQRAGRRRSPSTYGGRSGSSSSSSTAAATTSVLSAFETDRVRDATLQRAGIRVLRVTDQRFDNDPAGVLADIIALSRLTS